MSCNLNRYILYTTSTIRIIIWKNADHPKTVCIFYSSTLIINFNLPKHDLDILRLRNFAALVYLHILALVHLHLLAFDSTTRNTFYVVLLQAHEEYRDRHGNQHTARTESRKVTLIVVGPYPSLHSNRYVVAV